MNMMDLKLFHRILDEFEDKIRKNGCTWTTSGNNMAYSITRITDENYLYEYYLGKLFMVNNMDFIHTKTLKVKLIWIK